MFCTTPQLIGRLSQLAVGGRYDLDGFDGAIGRAKITSSHPVFQNLSDARHVSSQEHAKPADRRVAVSLGQFEIQSAIDLAGWNVRFDLDRAVGPR